MTRRVALEILPRRSIGFNVCPDVAEPRRLIEVAAAAERAGFQAIWVSDHFHPWFHTGAHECHAWTWMAAAMALIKLPFGTAVTAPLFRYHPAIVAQAFATLQAIYGPRVLLGLGTGEAMNEVPLGFPWPSLPERRRMLIEAVKTIRLLWRGGFVDFEGRYYRLRSACLYLRADMPILISALGPKMAREAGRHGDGIITATRTPQYAKAVLLPAFAQGCREAGKEPGDVLKVVELDVGYDPDYERALASVRKWASTLIAEMFVEEAADPRLIEKRGTEVPDERLEEVFVIGTDEEPFIRRIEEYFEVGFDHVYVLINAQDDMRAVDFFGRRVLPYFRP